MSNKKPISSNEVATVRSGTGIAPLVYRPAPGWNGGRDAGNGTQKPTVMSASMFLGDLPGGGGDPGGPSQDREIREEGFRQGVAQARSEMEGAAKQQRDAVAAALADFARERQAYFLRVESEVVSLAMAVARKILRRESQVDPLLLTGLVRVALEKISASETVRLRVSNSQLRLWQDYFFGRSDLPLVPDIVSDGALEDNQCRIETDHGSTDLGVEMQLKEIEQGLVDLLAQRPKAT